MTTTTTTPTRMYMSNGYPIPCVALGTYECVRGNIGTAVRDAIDAGYRHFDCAWIYKNEDEVGDAIRSKIVERVITRDDVFVTTKLWNNFHKREKVVEMLEDSLRSLGLRYVDLFLIHWPVGFKETWRTMPLFDGAASYSDVDYLETWAGMEDCVNRGLTKSIGLSNFNCEQIERILKVCSIPPVVNQVELHPFMNQKKLREYCHSRRIIVEAYCPLGITHMSLNLSGFPEPTVTDERIMAIGRKYGKTPAQVVMNYLIYVLRVVVVVKSVVKLRIVEAMNSLNFKLKRDDITRLNACNIEQRICPFEAFTDHPHYPFNAPF